MEDQTNPVFPVGGEAGETDPLMADALDGATTDGSEADDEESADGGSGDPNDDRAFLMDQAPAGSERQEADRADVAEALGLGVDDGDDPLDDGASR
ncbi:hypothetical protein [Microbacterium gorillae]|uniref:hypothetical protein n=1 Tax=Microbacterium gorillae TaxID=1231063 RepID=UPI003D971205